MPANVQGWSYGVVTTIEDSDVVYFTRWAGTRDNCSCLNQQLQANAHFCILHAGSNNEVYQVSADRLVREFTLHQHNITPLCCSLAVDKINAPQAGRRYLQPHAGQGADNVDMRQAPY